MSDHALSLKEAAQILGVCYTTVFEHKEELIFNRKVSRRSALRLCPIESFATLLHRYCIDAGTIWAQDTMQLYSTRNTAASIRKAHEAFTHIVVNAGYETIHPAYFRSDRIADLPIYARSSWQPSSASQLERWRELGGVLLNRDTFTSGVGPADVQVFVECPLSMRRINESCALIREYAVLPRPMSWSVHERAIDLRRPEESRLRLLWDICCGQRLSDDELAEYSGFPKSVVQYQRAGFGSREEWEMQPRLAPEAPGLLPAWTWIGAGRTAGRGDVSIAGHKAAVKEMARLGHIALKKIHAYPATEPDWTYLATRRSDAIADLNRVRSLVESLPDHLQAE